MKKFTFALVPLALLACSNLKADVVIIDTIHPGSLGVPYVPPNGSASFTVNSTPENWGVSFQVPGGQNYSFTSATFSIGFNPTTIPQPAPILSLYADNGSGSPGTLLDTLSLSTAAPQLIANSGTLEDDYDTYVPTAADFFAAGQSYWLVFSTTGQTFFVLNGDVGNPNTGTGTYLGAKLNTSLINTVSIPYFSVDAAAVPEPSGVISLLTQLTGLGIAGLLGQRKLRASR